MPLRTRDFLLYLLATAFLVIAITVTVLEDVHSGGGNVASVISTDSSSEEVIYTATVEEKSAVDRVGHLARLKSKMADFKDTITGTSLVTDIVKTEPVETTNEEESNFLMAELKCSTYQNFVKPWSPQGLDFSVVEGARLLYRDVETMDISSTTGSSTPAVALSNEVVLQLPLQTYGSANKNCLPSDVVGIALDGSLIKNNEFGLYSIFGEETLVGYALDGFPIYGQSDVETDECGGAYVNSQYRYYLSNDRPAVLYCYSGLPIEI